jgi:predicted nucleic acid-binding protein
MADRGEIWSKKLSERVLVVDADEIERLAKDREELRKAGKLCGRRPSGRKSA